MKKLFVLVALIGATIVYGFVRAQGPEIPSEPVIATTAASTDATLAASSSGAAASSSAPAPSSGAAAPIAPMMGSGGMMAAGQYRNGVYTGTAADAFYGLVQVKATIAGGRITDVSFLQYPNDRDTSRFINSQAMPMLSHEAIMSQKANVNIVSGATETSLAFRQSLAAALSQAS